MKVEFLKKFSKNLDNLAAKSVKSSLLKTIDLLEAVTTIDHIPNIKKLKGHKSAYRIRIGDYRLGIFP